MKSLAAFGLVLAATVSAFANDTTAQLTTGGLEFVTNAQIVMESEELFISKQEIRVVYKFRNDSETDQDILVAFPMPDLVPSIYGIVAFPAGPDDNLFEFETTIDGKPVDATLHEYAFAHGVDRSALIRELGLSLVPISLAGGEATDALDDATKAELLHLGMLQEDEYDAGDGYEKHVYPGWTYKATYTWEAHFPAGKTVTVEHRYKPSVGGTVGVSLLGEPDEGRGATSSYTKYCADDAFRDTVRQSLRDPADPYSAPFYESWISYILTTGGNWGGNGIEKFRLVVDKGSPDNLISFCGDDVKKIGPTTFEMVKENFWPEQELDILILERQSGEQ